MMQGIAKARCLRTPMKPIRPLLMALAAALTLSLSACSREDASADKAPPIAAAQALEVLAAEGKGFTVGATMAARTVYVLFDPQCPHCGHLWEASQPLLGKARFVWLPVAFISPKSLPQGAALLQSAQPLQTMAAHEKALLAGSGGMSASASVPDDIRAAIERNTRLLDRLGAESVPLIVTRSPAGQPLLHAGAMDTAALAALLGL